MDLITSVALWELCDFCELSFLNLVSVGVN